MSSVQEFNRLPVDGAKEALGRCCSAGRWIDGMASGRPYASVDDLLAASDAAVAALTQADLREALAGHPRIGDRRVAEGAAPGGVNSASAGWSGQEQAGVSSAGESLRQALDDGNAEYERRFGHIYLACATGRDAAELVDFLRQRLSNDRETEWSVIAGELGKINQIRLGKLLDELASSAPSTA